MEFSTQRSFTAFGSYWLPILFFFITTLTNPSINGYGGSPKVHDSGCIKLFLVYFIFREVDMEYWRDLAKGTIGFLFYLEHL